LNALNVDFFIEGKPSCNLLMTRDKAAVVVLETRRQCRSWAQELEVNYRVRLPLPTSDSALNAGNINQPHTQPWQ
jgi:hypothetical protein